MKQIQRILLGVLLVSLFLPTSLFAQDSESPQPKPTILIVTTFHWNQDYEDGSQKEWIALADEYFEKVTQKNEYIMGANFLTHYFTADNSEALNISSYENWAAIEKANDRTSELIQEAWSDSVERKAFFQKFGAYFTGEHSDEMYRILDGAKYPTERSTESMIYYVRVSHLAFPKDAPKGEFKALHNEYLENVVYKNKNYQAYFIHRHLWGADSREFTEVFMVNSLADIEAAFEENEKLSEAAWNEEEGKEYWDKYKKYWTGFHADYIYRSIPSLNK